MDLFTLGSICVIGALIGALTLLIHELRHPHEDAADDIAAAMSAHDRHPETVRMDDMRRHFGEGK